MTKNNYLTAGKKNRSKRNLQLIIQILFLVLFIFFIVKGKAQLWMGIFLFSIAASFLIGRVYCGWVCPINTVMKFVTWVKKKLGIKSIKTPAFFTRPWVRYLALGLFIVAFTFIKVTGKQLPVLPVLFGLGIVLTFFFNQEVWHRYLCPYGTILSLPASKTKHVMYIDPEQCNNCGMCKRVCPAVAVEKGDDNHKIIKSDCLICMECSAKCKRNAISYKRV